MHIGSLPAVPALDRPDLLAVPVAAALAALAGKLAVDEIGVAEIDPCARGHCRLLRAYDVAPGESANCVVVAGRRDGRPGWRPAWCSLPPART